MPLSFFRRVLDRSSQRGPIHEPKEDGQYALWRDAQAENYATIRQDVINLANVRDPDTTPILDDLEREFGVVKDPNLTETERRVLLEAERFKIATNASDDDLQTRLNKAGFNVTVYQNSPNGPAIDPAILLDQNFQMQMDQTEAFMGQDEAYMSRFGGYLLVNQNTPLQTPNYFGMPEVWMGNEKAHMGYFETTRDSSVGFQIPTDPLVWPFVFFIGGDATFNPDGSLLTIGQGFIPSTEQKRFETLVLKFKPIFTWCGVLVTYT